MSRAVKGGKRDANKALAQLVAEVDREGVRAQSTVDALLGAHIDHLSVRGRQQRTINGYHTIARGISKDPIGRRPLDKVRVKDIDDLYLRLTRRGRSPPTVERHHALLNGASNAAEADPTST